MKSTRGWNENCCCLNLDKSDVYNKKNVQVIYFTHEYTVLNFWDEIIHFSYFSVFAKIPAINVLGMQHEQKKKPFKTGNDNGTKSPKIILMPLHKH